MSSHTRSVQRKLNIAVLYDERHLYTSTVKEHVESFRNYSSHHVYYIPSTIRFWRIHDEDGCDVSPDLNLDIFDVVIVHYAVRLSIPGYFNDKIIAQLSRYNGLKILFIQDEYESTEYARSVMDRLKFDIIYTCVPESSLEQVYSKVRFPNTTFLPTLTGYVPEDDCLEAYAMPLAKRPLWLAYRGRVLDPIYGMLGREKFIIGQHIKQVANERGIPADIEVDDTKRIYGNDWYKFIGSARATLGSESGANVFDFDGNIRKSLNAAKESEPDISNDTLYERYVAIYDGHIRMNQISPKIFEAIRLRTALVLFEGSYSGVIQPDAHFIPLKKDFSNLDQVLAKLDDLDYLQAMVDRAYGDIIESGYYSYASFVRAVDETINLRIKNGPRYEIFSSPIIARSTGGTCLQSMPKRPIGYTISTGMLDSEFQREDYARLIDEELKYQNAKYRLFNSQKLAVAKASFSPADTMLGKLIRPVFAFISYHFIACMGAIKLTLIRLRRAALSCILYPVVRRLRHLAREKKNSVPYKILHLGFMCLPARIREAVVRWIH